MEYLSNDHEYHTRLQENSHKLYGEKGHPLLNLKKGQWKWRQQHDQSFSNGGKSTVEQTVGSEETNPKKLQPVIRAKKLIIWVMSFEKEKL